MVILGLEHVRAVPGDRRDHETGTIPPTVMWGSTPHAVRRVASPARSAHGLHVGEASVPLHGDARTGTAKRMRTAATCSRCGEHAPNLADAVLDSFTRTPLDTERRCRTCGRAICWSARSPTARSGDNRPFPGAGHYRGHLPGLYLCGSSCHPGGNITGLPGYNCAQVVRAGGLNGLSDGAAQRRPPEHRLVEARAQARHRPIGQSARDAAGITTSAGRTGPLLIVGAKTCQPTQADTTPLSTEDPRADRKGFRDQDADRRRQQHGDHHTNRSGPPIAKPRNQRRPVRMTADGHVDEPPRRDHSTTCRRSTPRGSRAAPGGSASAGGRGFPSVILLRN